MLSRPDFEYKQILFLFPSKGEKISFQNDNILIKDSEGSIMHQSTCYRLFAVFVVGHVSFTSAILQKAKKFAFSIIFLSYNYRFYGMWHSAAEGNVLLRQKQYSYTKFDIAAHIVRNKIANQTAILQKIRNKNDKTQNAISALQELINKIPAQPPHFKNLLGIEGNASKHYFQTLFSEHKWETRRPRLKYDTTNTLLDIGYMQLFYVIEGLLNLYGFDVYKGIYHQFFYQRKSLVCDIIEPFRPIIDARIKKAHALKQIHLKDFTVINNQYHLFGKNSKPYTEFLFKEILKYKNDIFVYIQKYYRSFIRETPLENYPSFNL